MANASHAYGEGRDSIPAIDQPFVIFMINRSLQERPETDLNVYRATQCGWVIGPTPRERAVYALGVVRGAYRIEQWRNVGGNRWCFDGHSAPELDVVGTSIERIKGKQGNSNPVRLHLKGIKAADAGAEQD